LEKLAPVALAELLEPHAGLWVAIKRGQVVEVAENPGLLSMRLQERQIRDATIIRAPRPEEPELVGLG